MWFFRPAWQSNNQEKALKAVETENNQTKLATIAQKASSAYVRITAVRKLTDQTVLESIAQNDSDSYVRERATGKLTNKDVLKSLFENDTSASVRVTAMNLLNDQSIYIICAKNDSDKRARIDAIFSLNDQDYLAELIDNSTDYDLCLAAWRRLNRLGARIDDSVREKIEKLNAEKCQREGHVWLYTTEYDGKKFRETEPCQRCGYVDLDYLISRLWG